MSFVTFLSVPESMLSALWNLPSHSNYNKATVCANPVSLEFLVRSLFFTRHDPRRVSLNPVMSIRNILVIIFPLVITTTGLRYAGMDASKFSCSTCGHLA